jgi:hypothetical protein
MKLIFAFLISFNLFSSTAFLVEGQLIGDHSANLILRAASGDLTILNKNFNAYGCEQGIFVVENSFDGEDGYTLLDVNQCKKFNDEEVALACPKNLEFVCGRPLTSCAPKEECIQVYPPPRTYPNKCLMIRQGATFLYKGSCQS